MNNFCGPIYVPVDNVDNQSESDRRAEARRSKSRTLDVLAGIAVRKQFHALRFISLVRKVFRIFFMIVVVVVVAAALAGLALITQASVLVLNRKHPAAGKIIGVAGAGIHVVDIGPRDGGAPPVVMIHGASSNLETMRLPVGDMLAKNRRVILIDRPGHGWSSRDRLSDSTPAIQGRMIDEALGKLGVTDAILVVHSWAGALGSLMALNYPQRVAGLVMLAPVAYPWPGGVGTYNEVVTAPVIGPLLAYTITLPLGLALVRPGTRGVFLPQAMPHNYVRAAAIALVLRPREFLANARDLVTLKAAVAEQAPRYAAIEVPTVVIHGDVDETVSLNIHSRPFAAAVPGAKLIVLPGAGHMVQDAAPDLVVREIEQMTAVLEVAPAATMRWGVAGNAGGLQASATGTNAAL